MKKLIAILCCLLLAAFSSGALASEIPDFPFAAPDDKQGIDGFPSLDDAQEGLRIEMNGESLQLDFDPATDYSSMQNGMIQASFFSFSENSDYLYELYLLFPENITAGTTISPDYALQNNLLDCSISMMVSTETNTQYYFASQMDGAVYPQGSNYALYFDEVTQSENGIYYSGTLTATIVELDYYSGLPLGSTQIVDAPFSFTMPLDGNANSPTSTVPPDMRKV